MNILTKISIVVLVLLNILAGVVFSGYAVSAPNYRVAFEREETLKEQSDLKARNADLLYSNAQSKLDDAQKLLTQQTGELESKIKTLSAELAEKNALIDDQEDTLEDQALELKKLNEFLVRIEGERDELGKQKTHLDSMFDRTQAEYTATMSDLADAQAQIERDAGEMRVLREQIVHHEEEIERLTSTLIDMGGDVAAKDPAIYTGAKLTASITAVQADGLASINIGQIGGAREGMVMFVYRGSDFVGHLRIEEVDDNASAGVIYDVREGMSVHQNDRVTNKFE